MRGYMKKPSPRGLGLRGAAPPAAVARERRAVWGDGDVPGFSSAHQSLRLMRTISFPTCGMALEAGCAPAYGLGCPRL